MSAGMVVLLVILGQAALAGLCVRQRALTLRRWAVEEAEYRPIMDDTRPASCSPRTGHAASDLAFAVAMVNRDTWGVPYQIEELYGRG